MIFSKIALAITFSPNLINHLLEVKRLKELFNAELFLIHIGEKSDEKYHDLKEAFAKCGFKESDFKLIWENGEAEDLIMNICIKNKIDLLIAGALKKENMINYYLGSVARTLMREAPCSVLFLMKKNEENYSFKKICVSVDFTNISEYTALKAFELAKLENSEIVTFIKEFEIPGLASTIYESEKKDELRVRKNNLLEEEKEKMKIFISELNLSGVNISTECLIGKQGWVISNWVTENNYDLLVIPSLQRKPKLIDRIFQHDWEFIFKELPSSLLIIKSDNSEK
ncbi:MAG: universal stress protein [Melioribacteraceae bacterium]|nr:universal stress protein [Melioribacteraceae bacterium]